MGAAVGDVVDRLTSMGSTSNMVLQEELEKQNGQQPKVYPEHHDRFGVAEKEVAAQRERYVEYALELIMNVNEVAKATCPKQLRTGV